MRIVRIECSIETSTEVYTEITFNTYWQGDFVKTCITENDNQYTILADSGEMIDSRLWVTVKSFINTKDNLHRY